MMVVGKEALRMRTHDIGRGDRASLRLLAGSTAFR